MLGSTHILVGSTIAIYSESYLFGGLAAFLSHLVVDVIPHYDLPSPNLNKPLKIIFIQCLLPVLETLGGVVALYLCFLINPNLDGGLLILGGFLSILPDIWHHVPFWREYTRKITPTLFKIHEDVQSEDLLPKSAGRMMNLIVIIFAIWFLLSY